MIHPHGSACPALLSHSSGDAFRHVHLAASTSCCGSDGSSRSTLFQAVHLEHEQEPFSSSEFYCVVGNNILGLVILVW